MADNTFMQNITDEVDEYQKSLKREAKEQELVAKRTKIDKKIDDLADKANRYKAMRTEEDSFINSVAEILETTLEFSLWMRDTLEVIQAVTEAMSCIVDIVQFIDMANSLDEVVWDEMNEKNYGLFGRIKQQMKVKKAIRNHANRMNQMFNSMMAKYKMSEIMLKSVKQFSGKINKSFGKKNTKKANMPEMGRSRAAEYMNKRAAEQGIEVPNSAPSSGSSANGASGGDEAFPEI